MRAPLKVRISARALVQIEEAAEWWAENRPSAPGAVRQDLADILAILVQQPGIGIPARQARTSGLRRVTLERIGYYLYYRTLKDTLDVLAFWHVRRQQPFVKNVDPI